MSLCEKDPVLQAKMDELGSHLMSEEWLFQRGKPFRERGQDSGGLNVIRKAYKAPGD